MRQRVSYLMARLKSGNSATLQAYGTAINTAIWMANIIRNKMGDIHQLVTICELKDDKRESQGIQILLSTAQLDVENIGYQKAEEKGFWPREKPRRRQSKAEPAPPVDKKKSEKAEGPAD